MTPEQRELLAAAELDADARWRVRELFGAVEAARCYERGRDRLRGAKADPEAQAMRRMLRALTPEQRVTLALENRRRRVRLYRKRHPKRKAPEDTTLHGRVIARNHREREELTPEQLAEVRKERRRAINRRQYLKKKARLAQ